MIITAKFKGVNSLGYERGKEYKLKLSEIGGISIKREDDSGLCFYNSLTLFLNNWDNITSRNLIGRNVKSN